MGTFSGTSTGWLLVSNQGLRRAYRIPERGSVSLGRSPDNDICIEDPMVSRHHAILHVGDVLRIEDAGSGNGTTVEVPSRRLDGGDSTARSIVIRADTRALDP